MALMSRRTALVSLGRGSIGLGVSVLFSCDALPPNPSAQHAIKRLDKPVDLVAQVARLKQLAPAKYSQQYQPPTKQELAQFQALAEALVLENMNRALALANRLNYQLVQFTERASQQPLLGVWEKPQKNQSKRGWGSYWINLAAQTPDLVECPHILFDRLTPEIGAQIFRLSKARGFLMAGAHRNANGLGTADVCDPIASMFQAVHKGWSKDGANTWQIHGFSDPVTKGFPKPTQIVLSNGTGNVSQPMIALDQMLEKHGFSTYVYNELSPGTAINQTLNGEVAGTRFSSLAATQNVQGIYSRQIGAPFYHIEIEPHVRAQARHRERLAQAITHFISTSH